MTSNGSDSFGGAPGSPPNFEKAPRQPAFGETPDGQPTSGQPTYGQTTSDQPTYGQPTYGQVPYGQPVYGQPAYGQPAYGQPPYGQPGYSQPGYPGYPNGYVMSPGTNPLAIVSLVLSIVPFIPFIGSIAAIALGFVARSQIKRTGQSGGVMATLGIVFGFLWVAGIITLITLIAVYGHDAANCHTTNYGTFDQPDYSTICN